MELRASEALANTITPELLREALTTVLQTYAAGDPAGPSAVVALIRERLAAAGRAWAAAEQGAAARRAAAEERARNNAEGGGAPRAPRARAPGLAACAGYTPKVPLGDPSHFSAGAAARCRG